MNDNLHVPFKSTLAASPLIGALSVLFVLFPFFHLSIFLHICLSFFYMLSFYYLSICLTFYPPIKYDVLHIKYLASLSPLMSNVNNRVIIFRIPVVSLKMLLSKLKINGGGEIYLFINLGQGRLR